MIHPFSLFSLYNYISKYVAEAVIIIIITQLVLECFIIPLSVKTIYGLPMSFVYITNAVIKKKMGTM